LEPTGQLVTSGGQEVIVYSFVWVIVEVIHGVGAVVVLVSVSVTGQTVVYQGIVSVVVFPIFAGQSVTVAAQLVMV